MIKQRYRTAVVVAVAVTIAACASSEIRYREDPNHSTSMNLLMAAGLIRNPATAPVRDLSAYRLVQVPEGEAVRPRIRWARQNYVSPDVERTMERITEFHAAPGEPLHYPQILVFKPASDGEKASEAQQVIEESILDAILKTAAGKYRISQTATPSSFLPLVFDRGQDRRWYVGPDCSPGTCEVEMRWTEKPPFRMPAPEGIRRGGRVWLTTVHPVLPRLAEERLTQQAAELSAELPDWAYLYIPPWKGGKAYPVIYHQGRPMYFIAPVR